MWEPVEGRTLLEQVERVFSQRDPERLVRTKTMRGMLALRSGEWESAANTFHEVLAATPREDEEAYADALRNVLWTAAVRDRVDDDLISQLDILEALDARRGRQVNVLRDRWIRGLVSLSRGHLSDAVALLRDTMRGFEATGNADTSIRVGIDAVRALIAAERFGECVELARDLVARCMGFGPAAANASPPAYGGGVDVPPRGGSSRPFNDGRGACRRRLHRPHHVPTTN